MPGITINSKLDTRPVKSSLTELNQYIQSLRGTVAKAGRDMDASVVGYAKAMSTNAKLSREVNDQVERLDTTYRDLLQQVEDLANTKIDTKEYADLKKEIDGTEKQLRKLQETQQRLKDLGKDVVPTKEYAAVNKSIDATRKRLTGIEEEYDKQITNAEAASNNAINIRSRISNEEKAVQDFQTKLAEAEKQAQRFLKSAYGIANGERKISVQMARIDANYSNLIEKAQEQIADSQQELESKQWVDPVAAQQIREEINEYREKIKVYQEARAAKLAELQAEDTRAKSTDDYRRYQEYTEYVNAYKQSLNDARTRLESYRNELPQAESEENKYVEIMTNLEEQLEAAQSEYDKLIERRKELEASGGDMVNTDAMRRNQYDIQKVTERLQKLQQQKEDMESKGNATVTGDTTREYGDLITKADQAEEKLRDVRKKAQESAEPIHLKEWEQMTTVTGAVAEGFARLKNAAALAQHAIENPMETLGRIVPVVASGIANLAGRVYNLAVSFGKMAINRVVSSLQHMASSAIHAATGFAKMAASTVVSFIQRLAVSARNAAVNLTRMAGAGVISGLKKIGSFALKAGSALLNMGKSAKRSNGGLKQSLTMILRYTLGIRSLFMLVRRLRSAVVDAFNNMAKKVPEVNKTISSMASSLDMVKNSLATAFQPILTAIAPYLVQLMDMLAGAMTKIGEFFAALTGQNYVYRATKAQIDYAKSLDKTKKKAKETENQLAGFDHLNILKDNKSDSDSDDNTTPTSDFEKVPIDSKIADFARKLADAFRNNELYKIGKQFADLVNGFFKDTARWEEIGKKLGKIINGIVDVFNGFMDNVQWEDIGKAIGKAIDGLLDTVRWDNLGKAFSQKINAIFGVLWGIVQDEARWKKTGKALAELVEGFFGNIKWDLISKTIGTAINGIATAITEFATNFPWGEMGKKLASGIRNLVDTIDIEKVYTAFSTMLQGILDFIYPALSDTETWKKIADDFTTFLKNFFEDDKLWNKASEALQTGLKNAIMSLNRIFGNETIMADIGSRLSKFLNDLMGDKELWGGIGDLANNMMKGVLTFGKSFLDDFEPTEAADNIKLALGKIKWKEEIAPAIWDIIKEAFSKTGSFVDALFSESTEGLSGKALQEANDFNAKPFGVRVAEKIKGAFDLEFWKDVATTVWNTAKQGFTIAGDFISTMLGIDTADMNAGERIVAIGEELGKKLGELGAAIGEKLSTLPWEDIFKTTFKMIGDTLNGLIGGLLGNESGNGKVLLWIAGGIAALKLGIVPLLAKLIAGLASGILAGGPILEAAVVAAFGAAVYKMTELTIQMVQAQKDLNAALRNEASSGLDSYVNLYHEKGADVANKWAKMCYGLELEGNNLQENLKRVGDTIAANQGTAFADISADAAVAGAAYRMLAEDAEKGGMDAANSWAESVLNIKLSSDDLEENIRGVKDAVKVLATDDSIRNEIKNACNEIVTEGTNTADIIESKAATASESAKASIQTNANEAVAAVEDANANIATSAESVEETIRAAMVDGNEKMKADIESTLNDEAKAWDDGLNTINETASTGYSKTVDTVTTKTGEMAKASKTTTDDMTSTATQSTAEIEKEYIDKYYSIAYIVDVSMSDAANYMKRHTDTMMQTIRNGMRDMVNIARQSMNDMVQTMRSVDFQPIGANIIQGIANGINNGWSWLNNLVYNLANSLFRSAKNALGIASPSKVFRDEVGYMVGAGLAEGLDDSQRTVLGSVADMATAMVDEMQGTDITADIGVSENTLLDGLNNVLTSFSGTVENSFVTLTQRLQAIADTVTFRTPGIAAGLVLPYAIQGQSVNTEAVSVALDKNNEELISVIIQAVNNQTSAIVQALERYSSSGQPMDMKSATSIVIDEINRRTRAAGKSPLLI